MQALLRAYMPPFKEPGAPCIGETRNTIGGRSSEDRPMMEGRLMVFRLFSMSECGALRFFFQSLSLSLWGPQFVKALTCRDLAIWPI